MKATDIWKIQPQADPRAVIRGEKYRITVLTDRLFRLEYAEDRQFQDTATQMALCRSFPVPDMQVTDEAAWLTVETACVRLQYDRKPFSSAGLSATLKGSFAFFGSVWHYGDKASNLGGTVRTLDEADGEVPLGDGLACFDGYAVLDDSASMGMDETGKLLPARPHGQDLYLFAYGHDFTAAMKDFFRLSGPTPVLPRFALGNWWSRYYPYTQEEYQSLMERFQAEEIPLAVSVIDMDWHITEIDPKYGTGWTGYTWDREKFPDPEELLSWLHAQGLKVTLNDHPADGIRPCEEFYPDMARALGEDPAGEKSFAFDAADDRYLQAFDQTVLEPLEQMGVDFWWLDWQQKGGSTDPGVDPLMTLNHTRYLRSLATGRTPLILSRFGGPGSHRYPVGFSGDTCITWASLAFQPYFTATAANIGYGWWSHDIGGHMHGIADRELTVRWTQFGVFSPVMRLHSTKNFFMNKEPWNFPAEKEAVMKDFLRLRHRLLPWLYTQNVRCSEKGELFLRPMYYELDGNWELFFRHINQYLLGDCMTVCPITQPMDRESLLGETEAVLPAGTWTDFFTGWRYVGGGKMRLYRTLSSIPVLVKDGGIVPMDGSDRLSNGAELPETVLLRLFPGADGETDLIEDNGLPPADPEYRRVVTRVRMRRAEGLTVEILPPEGEASVLPSNRHYVIELNGVADILPDGIDMPHTYNENRRTLTLRPTETACILKWNTYPETPELNRLELLRELLWRAETSYDLKIQVYEAAQKMQDPVRFLTWLHLLPANSSLYGAILELFSAC